MQFSYKKVKHLTVIKHLVSSPPDDKNKSYYTALAKQSHTYNEVLFISANIISFVVQTEQKADNKPPPIEHTSPNPSTPEKLSSILNNRTINNRIKDITHLLEPYKQIALTLSSPLSHI